jgi:pilus assembly protein CpaC
MARDYLRKAVLAATALAAITAAAPALAQASAISVAEGVHAGEVAVPVNKSQVIRSDRPYAKALIGSPEVADVLPLTDQSLYVLGKKMGTTSLTLYDRSNMLIAVVDVVVGPDVISLRRQLSELVPAEGVGARISNDSIVLEGVVPDAVAADRAVQLAETYAPGKVVNMLSLGSSQQVMLEVRFSEIKRSALKSIGVGMFVQGGGNHGFGAAIGGGASLTPGGDVTTTIPLPGGGTQTQTTPGTGIRSLGSIVDSFGILQRSFSILGLGIDATLDALERKGAITTLAEPTLVSLSGETASFLAGGEFPVPVAQNAGTGGGGASSALTVEWKPFGVSLAFTPTVLADGVISLIVAPEVSSIDPTASIVINNLRIPGIQTRRAKTTVELRDGESFAMAGLIRKDFQDTVRQFPILGSIPIIGSLFRSTNFQKEDTELLIIVTPRLVRPVRVGSLRVPTDRAAPPPEADLFFLGRTDAGVPPGPVMQDPHPLAPPPAAAPGGGGGSAQRDPSGFEKEYGHVL